MSLSAGTRLGTYEILAPLGAGGMGEVYKARDVKLDRDVAIKVLPTSLANDPERLERFEREAKVLAALNHLNIAQVYGLQESNSIRALVMEFVPGDTLKGPLPLETALNYAKQIAEALEASHEKGITHRDLKPANLMVTPEGVIKVLDFGLAAVAQPPTSNSDPANSPTLTMAATQAGMIMGTAGYMSPEQAAGKFVDRRADIWSFGVVLFEMLAGGRLFEGETISHTLADVLRAPINFDKLPTDTPLSIRNLLRRCLDRNTKNRLRDIGEARVSLQNPLAGAESPPPSPPQRLPLAWTAFAVAILALAALVFVHFREKPPEAMVVHATIPLPKNSDVTQFALSPDGKRLALGLSTNGKFSIWTRSLDSDRMELLTGDDEGVAPFWSPDGRYVGFFADGKLKIAPANGGPVRTVCDADSAGGAWSQSGVIIFGSRTGSISKVPAAGGPCVAATKAEPGIYHDWPIFLPDDKHFLYSAQGADESKVGVFVASLNDPAGSKLLGEQTRMAFAPARRGAKLDYLLFRRGPTLMAQSFDTKAFVLSGDPFPIATGTSRGLLNNLGASVAPNGLLVYLSNGFSSQQFAPTWFDRSGQQLEKLAEPAARKAISLSPNEKFVAYPLFKRGVWLLDVTGKGERRLTSPSVPATAPVWSPDSSRIAFSAGNDLFLTDLNGGTPGEPFLSGPNRKTPSDWSRDGRFLLYTDYDPKTGPNIWFLEDPARPGEHKPVPFLQTKAAESRGQFSSDGKWVAYVSDKSGEWEIYVRPFPSGTQEWKISSSGGSEPRWRRDDKEIFYLEGKPPRLRLMVVPIRTGAGTLESGVPKTLFDVITMVSIPPDNVFGYSPSADGQRFLVSVYAVDAEPTLNVVTNWQTALKK